MRKLWNWVKRIFVKPAPTPTPPKPIEVDVFTPRSHREHYSRLWGSMVVRREKISVIRWYVNKINEGKARYQEVEKETGVPWQLIGAKHLMEGAGDFSRVLHNGERILGTGRKTRLVPKNRGPFETWEEAAIDALRIKKQPKDWTIENTLYYCEKWNGLGYLRDHRKPHSPFLWSFTNHYNKGKYTYDGYYDPNAVSKQAGVAPVLKELGFFPTN